MSLFLFLLVSEVGCSFCLWLFLDFSIYLFVMQTKLCLWVRFHIVGLSIEYKVTMLARELYTHRSQPTRWMFKKKIAYRASKKTFCWQGFKIVIPLRLFRVLENICSISDPHVFINSMLGVYSKLSYFELHDPQIVRWGRLFGVCTTSNRPVYHFVISYRSDVSDVSVHYQSAK